MSGQAGSILNGVKVLELGGLAPGPFAGYILSDWGADVVRAEPVATKESGDILARGKRTIQLNLKSQAGVNLFKTLLGPQPADQPEVWRADVLIDPFRPGVLDRLLGVSSEELIAKNPRLIICRLTGFRRVGITAKMAGHDINYLALSGLLSLFGRKGEKPYSPINFAADFAGGGFIAAFGIVLAILARTSSGKGQIVDTDMVTGARYVGALLVAFHRPSRHVPGFDGPRGTNLLDGGSPWYETYETKDGGFMSVGAIEPQFYKQFTEILLANTPSSIHPSPKPSPATQHDKSTYPGLMTYFTKAFKLKTRKEWTDIYMGTDSCVAPVLYLPEIDSDGASWIEGHNVTDGSNPNAAPHLSVTPGRRVEGSDLAKPGAGVIQPGLHTKEILQQAGYKAADIEKLLKEGAIVQRQATSKL